MKLVLRLVMAFFCALTLIGPVIAQERTATFGTKERQEITTLLTTQISDSDTNALVNKTYDILIRKNAQPLL